VLLSKSQRGRDQSRVKLTFLYPNDLPIVFHMGPKVNAVPALAVPHLHFPQGEPFHPFTVSIPPPPIIP
jgi:hypothetical protein